MTDDVVHYVGDGNPPPLGVGLCGQPGVTVWRVNVVTCEECRDRFFRSLMRLRQTWNRQRRREGKDH